MATTLTVGLSRKLGLPGYSSVGADCSLTIEIDSALLCDAASLMARIAAAQAIVAEAVDAELARQQGEDHTPPREDRQPVAVAPVAAARTNGHHDAAVASAANGPARAAGLVPGRQSGEVNGLPPQTGRQLYAWVKRQEEDRGIVLLKYLNGWAKLQGMGYRMDAWTEDDVAAAYAEACRKLGTVD